MHLSQWRLRQKIVVKNDYSLVSFCTPVSKAAFFSIFELRLVRPQAGSHNDASLGSLQF